MKVFSNKMQWLVYSLLLASTVSCKKFLDESPDKKLAIPSTLADCSALLQYTSVMGSGASYGEVSADNYYLTPADFSALIYEGMRSAYTWQPAFIFDTQDNDWFRLYRKIYTSNVVLAALPKIAIDSTNEPEWKTIKGEALFVRALSFLQAAELWALAYDPATAATLPGIPLRLSDDFNEQSVRASIQQSYEQVLLDFKQSIRLLPGLPSHPVRPSKAAAYAFLSRAYLAIGDYEAGLKYSDSSLQLRNSLLDYNTVATNQTYSFRQFNVEQLFYNTASSPHLINARARVDSNLYRMYAATDRRKLLFFRQHADGSFLFKGSYTGGSTQFAGIATDEVYLTRAECYARRGNTLAALADLNTLLKNRIQPAAFVPIGAATGAQALDSILLERRKELPFRFVRWMDIKRLNRDGADIVLTRKMNGQTFTLVPNDKRYALPIPEDIIRISGMPQNPR
ncbi:MAG: RagB/SusD family nutrient uptake outer membrane protein [Sphingobacteriales bacterium]|nr:MAG: RagB/SusD family nutrient uptake outer membrane protein [Sphingobacteriales bacterium]